MGLQKDKVLSIFNHHRFFSSDALPLDRRYRHIWTQGQLHKVSNKTVNVQSR